MLSVSDMFENALGENKRNCSFYRKLTVLKTSASFLNQLKTIRNYTGRQLLDGESYECQQIQSKESEFAHISHY